jgi:tRNA(Arg) A34 adenosine deaminase TadA
MNSYFMARAVELSRLGMERGAGGPFGCVIVSDNRIIAEAYNEVVSSNDPTAHAEMLAIRRACHRLETFLLDDCDIYTSCEPCPMCSGALYWSHIAHIYYANTRRDASSIDFDDEFIQHQLNLPKTERYIPLKRIRSTEAEAVFADWQDQADKVSY